MVLGTDKQLHILASYAITLTIAMFTCWWIGGIVAILIDIGKEVYDKVSGKGTPEWKDFFADAVGVIVASAFALLFAT